MIIPQVKNGILNIDKPQGITSHDVVDVIKKLFPNMKVGHTGTLDPLATGVLPICIGEATKLTNQIISENKTYKVKMLLGVETDTYDVTGKIMFASTVNKDEIYIKERIKRFIGIQEQIPPMYSAIRVNGKRAYSYAREGKNIKLLPRKIEIYSIDNIKVDMERREVEFVVQCSKGTYIRSLCEDIAKRLNTVGYMQDLERSRVGKFDIKDSITIEELEQNIEDSEFINQHFITIENYFKDKESIKLNEKRLSLFLNGVKLTHNLTDDMYKIYDENNKFVGIGSVKNNLLKREIIVEN